MDKKNIKNIYKLAPLQEGMLFHSLLDDGKVEYIEQMTYHITGRPDITLFEKTWNILFKRHDVLRTFFIYKNVPEPLQVVLKERRVVFSHENIEHLDIAHQKETINAYKENDRKKGFDLTKDVLMRIKIFSLSNNSHEVVWSFHHIILDGWCMSVIQEEFAEIYKSLKKGKDPLLPPAPQYNTYIKWLSNLNIEKSLSYWENYLKKIQKLTGFPKMNQGDGFDMGLIQFSLGSELTSALSALAIDLKVTLNTLVQAVWGILISRYNALEDVVFGATVSGRPPEIPGINNMMGLFINAIPVRVSFFQELRFKDLAAKLQDDAVNGQEHHFCSLAEIQSRSPLKRNLFDHLLAFENYPISEKMADGQFNEEMGFVIDGFDIHEQTNYDLAVQVFMENSLEFKLRYNRNLYSDNFMTKVRCHLKNIINAVISDKNITFNRIDILSIDEVEEGLHAPAPLGMQLPADMSGLSDIRVFIADEEATPLPKGVYGKIYLAVKKNGSKYSNRFHPHPYDAGYVLSETDLWGRIIQGQGCENVAEIIGNKTRYMEMLAEKGEAIMSGRDDIINIAVTASFTAELTGPYIEWWLSQFNCHAKVEFAPYNQVFQELLDQNSLLNGNRDGINVLFLRFEDWIRNNDGLEPETTVELIEYNYDRFKTVLNQRNSEIPLFIGIFDHENKDPVLGIFLKNLYSRFHTFIKQLDNVYPIDFRGISKSFSISEIFDPLKDKAGHIPFSDAYFSAMGAHTARKITAFKAQPFKVIVLDCDNTLWKGIVGEDGTMGVSVSGGYTYLQEFVLERMNEGMLIAICSKNNEKDVWEVFENNPGMVLKKDNIVAHRINWLPKSENIQSMAEELNLSVESFIFLDDSPMECSEVMMRAPSALSILLPENPDDFEVFLGHIWAFDKLKVTEEDKKRSRMYMAEQKRKAAEKELLSLDDFLFSLGLKLYMGELKDNQIPRVSQLTKRTNQFNLTTIRRSEDEISKLSREEDINVFTIEVEDKFGDYGLVGVVIARIMEGFLFIDTFLLSCRVLGRGVERAILNGLKLFSEERKLTYLAVEFRETLKNAPALKFLKESGWKERGKTEEGTFFKIETAILPKKVDHIEIHFENRPKKSEQPVQHNTSLNQAVSQNSVPDHKNESLKGLKWSMNLINEEALKHKAYYQPLFNSSEEALINLPISDILSRNLITPFAPPETEAHADMTSIWKEVLNLEEIGIDDNYFQLGGHSLAATRIISRIYKKFKADITLKEMFDHPTVRGICAILESRRTVAEESISLLPLQDHYEVSHSQRRLWILDRMEENFVAYNQAAAYISLEKIDIDALKEAILKVCMRHESLRTTFCEVNGEPRQRISKEPLVDFIEFTLNKTVNGSVSSLEKAKALLNKEAARHFDLERGPLFKVIVIQLSGENMIISFMIHHIVCDGWSFSIMKSEIEKLYQKIAMGQPYDLDPLDFQYKEFARYQNMKIEALEADRGYWKEKLKGELPILDLPIDYPRKPLPTYNGETVKKRLSCYKALHIFAQKVEASLFMTILTGLKALLFRYTGMTDIIIGSPVSGRNLPEFENLIGFFVNTIALRDEFTPKDSFAKLLNLVKTTVSDAHAHQMYPFDKLLEEVGIIRDVSRSPVFNVMLVLQNREIDGKKDNSDVLALSPFEFEPGVSQFDLTFIIVESHDGLDLEINYNSDLFKRETVERFSVHFDNLLASGVENPESSLLYLELIPAAERIAVLNTFNNTSYPYPNRKTIPELFDEQVQKTPENIAVISGNEMYSYRKLNEMSNTLASYLKNGSAIRREEPVAVLAYKNEWLIVALLGIMKAGGAYLPIDPKYPSERIEYMLETSNCRTVLTDRETSLVKNAVMTSSLMSNLEVEDESSYPLTASVGADAARKYPSYPHDIAYVIFTSGSTGAPKGVMATHTGFINMSLDQIRGFGITEDDRVLLMASPSFDASLSEIFMSLFKGAALVMIDSETVNDRERFLEFIDENGITVITFTPSYLSILDKAPMPTVKVMIMAGEPLILEDALFYAGLKNLTGGYKKRCFNAYGPTEISVCATYHEIDPEISYGNVIPIGKPISNIQTYVLDEKMNPSPIGIPGELYLSGAGLTKGYINRPDLTDKAFIENPFNIDGKIYKTGDLVKWTSDGNIIFLGRKDDQVKVRGYRIELAEIESILKKRTEVSDAVVIMRESAKTNDMEILAYVTGNNADADGLKDYLRRALPLYMMPHHLMVLPRFPLTVNGKLNKKALPEPLKEKENTKKDPPQNDVQRRILEGFQVLFNNKNIGIRDNFFELGGDSIRAIQLVSIIKDKGLYVKVTDIFQYQSVVNLSEVAAAIDGKTVNKTITGLVPLTPIQKWFFETYPENYYPFNQAEWFITEKRFDAGALEKAIKEVWCHHDALRSAFKIIKENGKIIDVMQETGDIIDPYFFEVMDETASENAPDTLMISLDKRIQNRMDPEVPPVFRTVLLRTQKDDRLFVAAHHLVCDAVSWRIILQDIFLAYDMALRGEPLTCSYKTDSYQDFSKAIDSYATSDDLLSELSYWKSILSTEFPDIPFYKEIGENTVKHGAVMEMALDVNETSALLTHLGKTQGISVLDALLSAIATSLMNEMKIHKAFILLEGHGRESSFNNLDLSRTVGWFTTTFPVVICADASGDVLKTALVIKDMLSKIPNNGFGFNVLKYKTPAALKKEVDFTKTPQISVNYLGHYDEKEVETAINTTGVMSEFSENENAPINYKIALNAVIDAGRLRVFAGYHKLRLSFENMNAFMCGIMSDLKKF